MKTQEEYLIQYEERLLSKLEVNYKDLNRFILYTFSLMFVFILFEFKLLKDATIFGNKMEFTARQFLIVMPLVIIIPYFLINNSVRSIARIVNLLIMNAKKIKSINENSRPFLTEDLDYLSQGVASLQLQFSKWIVKNYLTNRKFLLIVLVPKGISFKEKILYTLFLPFKLLLEINELVVHILRTLFWIIFLVLIYILPLVISLWILYVKEIKEIFIEIELSDFFNTYFLIGLAILITIIYTLISNLILYSLFFSEITELKQIISKDTTDRIKKGFMKIIKYYKNKQEDNTI